MVTGKKVEKEKTTEPVAPVPEHPTSPPFIDRLVSPISIIVIVILVALLSIGAYFYARKSLTELQPYKKSSLLSNAKQKPTLTPTIEGTPRPSPRAIPHGPKGFTVSQGDKTVPQFGRGTIDPYDPENGATQTVTIAVSHTQPITKVSAILKTDKNISNPIPFTLKSGTNTNGEWTGNWRMTDSYLYTYHLVLQAESAGSKPASVEITLR